MWSRPEKGRGIKRPLGNSFSHQLRLIVDRLSHFAASWSDPLTQKQSQGDYVLVKQILSAKSVGGITTTHPDVTIADATQLLSSKRIGALIVSEDGKSVTGILSERDIVRELGDRGAECLSAKVSDLMTRDVVGCTPGDSAVSVLQKMTEGRFRHMPVMENGEMVGVISIGDVVKARIDEVEHENEALTEMIAGHG